VSVEGSAGMRRQVRMRERNEWIEQAHDAFDGHHREHYVCECTDEGCAATIALTRAEYETVRASGIAFVVEVNHEDPRSEHVVDQTERFAVVQTVRSELATMARRDNPRSSAPMTDQEPDIEA
jgi:hypothetical protein